WAEIDRLNPELRSEMTVPPGKVVRLPSDAKAVGASVPSTMPGATEPQDALPPKGTPSVRPLPVVRPRRPAAKAAVSQPLTGTYACQFDEKRCLVLPRQGCEQLGNADTVLLAPGPDRCLWLGTQAGAARVLERVEKSGAADQDVQAFRRVYCSQSEKAAVDASGKLAVCDKLAEYAGLGKELVLIGIDD